MRRGTTPIIKMISEHNWIGYDEIWVTFEQTKNCSGFELTLKGDRVKVSEGGTEIYVQLTQEETLAFAKGSAKVQIKGVRGGNLVEATDAVSIKILDILNEEVM